MRFILKDSTGKPSASYTMMITAFIVVTLWLALSIFESLGPVHIRAFSGTEAMAFLSPILLLYWGRKGQQLSSNFTGPNGSDSKPPPPPSTETSEDKK